ncbi:MAG TPA: PilX N-terminal domain-containing pilus assembly protein [Burkholderiales bacterium]|jgi:Tfp pilus assembly protein PilX
MRSSTPALHRQRGATLLISLVFLVVLTLLAVSGINTSIINLRTANNSQISIEAQAAAQQQIEQVLNSMASFTSVAGSDTTTNVDMNGDGVNDYTVVTKPPKCLSISAAPGYSYAFAGSAPKDTVWEVIATASDSVFGSSVTLRQGVKVRLPVDAVCVN